MGRRLSLGYSNSEASLHRDVSEGGWQLENYWRVNLVKSGTLGQRMTGLDEMVERW